ncbi:permease [Saccharopolyspora sp. WRP15-2]|uniref:Permease n=1 Tax=Saccharopolyspora oryzae TaxID=2997343 RepID=A0ABT4USI9_9PSEU|nr:Na+/H+ antiporter NhaC family protein [Saccharopolyspora oryzae]MDA3624681.1 permease [Saccharopolyspora oryzae]
MSLDRTLDAGDTAPARANTVRRRIQGGLVALGLIASAVLGPLTEPPTLWGLLPLGLFVVLLLIDLDIVIAAVVTSASALLVLGSNPAEAAGFLGDALGSDVLAIGMIIVLGGGLGEVLLRTGAAADLVRMIMRKLGDDSPARAQLGIMLASAVLVVALGTLIGAFALAAPLVIPIAARLGFTKSGTALMLFVGGTCGMFVAPFVGSMVAIRTASGISYPDFVLTAGGPLAVACFAAGFALVRWNLRHPVDADDYYGEEDEADSSAEIPAHARASTVAFLVAFVAIVAYAVIAGPGTAFAALALLVMAAVAGFAGRLKATELLTALYEGCGRLFNFLLMFWLLGALFLIIEEINPYEVLMAQWGGNLQALGTFAFLIIVGLIGWLGIQGASAAQVVLVDKIFGPTAAALGVPVPAWSVVLLASAQADTYGPAPGVNMIAPVGMARSTALKRVLYSSWILLFVSLAVYAVELAILH